MNKELETLIYKKKLNNKYLLDILESKIFSKDTVESMLNDLREECSDIIYAFSDGGCYNNGKKDARGAYSIYFTDRMCSDDILTQFNKSRMLLTESTNNISELSGVKAIFKTIAENADIFKGKDVVICTDSSYSIKCLDEWCKKWQKNDWKTSKGEEVKNKDLILEIVGLRETIKPLNVTFKHIHSHLREPFDKTSMEWFLWNGNNIVDKNISKVLASKIR